MASDEMAQVQGTKDAKVKTDGEAAGEQKAKLGAAGPEAGQTEAQKEVSEAGQTKPDETEKQESEAPEQDSPKDTRAQTAAAGAVPPPPPKPAPPTDTLKGPETKPSPHPQLKIGGSLTQTLRPEAPSHADSKLAKLPGPDASRDEYLAYVNSIITERLNATHTEILYPLKIGINIRRDGIITITTLENSSGNPAIDARAREVIQAIGRFPALPNYLGKDHEVEKLYFGPTPSGWNAY